ncbi:MAG TPA: S49 family peptidase [Thermoanaerobaculia bacterium]
MTKRPATRIIARIESETWAILPSALDTIRDIVARNDTEDLRAAYEHAVSKRDGEPLKNSHATEVRDGVAIIQVMGPIIPYADVFSEISGATSIDSLAQDFHVALTSNEVRAIVFVFDSPGGTVNGLFEFADMIYEARGTKPILGYIRSLCASAAYSIASACDRIIAADSAEIGSNGTIVYPRKPTKDAEAPIVSRRATRKALDILAPEGRADVQARLDALEDLLLERLARNRNIEGEDLDALSVKFGSGGLLMAKAAMEAGMVDEIGSFEELLGRYSVPTQARSPYTPRFNAGSNTNVLTEAKTTMATQAKTIEQQLADANALIATQQAQLAESKKHAMSAIATGITAEVTAFVAPFKIPGEKGDMRFAQAELVPFEAMYTKAKRAAAGLEGDDAALTTFGAFMVTQLEAFAKAKAPAAPAGALPAVVPSEAGTPKLPTKAEFDKALMGDRAAAKVVNEYVSARAATDTKKTFEVHLSEARAEAALLTRAAA